MNHQFRKSMELWTALGLMFFIHSEVLAQVDIEPNNLCIESQIIGAITPPFVLNGSLDTPPSVPDVDFFQFTSEVGLDLVADLKGAETGVGTLSDPFLGLFDSNCDVLSINDDFGSLDSHIRFTVPDDGVFILAASSCCDGEFVGSGGSAGTYELAVSLAPPSTCPTPTAIDLPATLEDSVSIDDCSAAELFGFFDDRFVDQYSVSLPADGVLSIALGAARDDAYFELWGTGLSEFLDGGFGGTAATSLFLSAGTYTVLVGTFATPQPPVSYSLSASFEETNIDPNVQLAAAVLPGSRSAQVGSGEFVTAFATIINTGFNKGLACSISPVTAVPAEFFFRINTGNTRIPFPADIPVDISPFEATNFVFGFLPNAAFDPTDIEFAFACENSAPAQVISGLNTFLLSASVDPAPDIMVNGATLCNDGIARLSRDSGVGVFAVAATNLGASGDLTVTIDGGDQPLPATLTICQTNSVGQCINPTTPSASPVAVTVGTDAVVTFGLFITGTAPIEPDAVNNRLFVRFTDSDSVTRGSTSVAVQTEEEFFFGCF